MDNKDIYNLLKEVREDQVEHGKQLVRTNVCLEKMEVNVQENTTNLKEHMRRTAILEEKQGQAETIIKDHSQRIEVLEEPVKVKKYLQKKYLTWAGIISAGLGIIALVAKILGAF